MLSCVSSARRTWRHPLTNRQTQVCRPDHALLDNTLIIFTADHGEMLGDHGCIQKCMPYDGATRIPMIMRYPARLAAGTERSAFVDLNDILPTVLDCAGLTHPEPAQLAGGSVFRDDKDRATQYISLGYRARRFATVRDQRYKYTYYYSLDDHELFDLANDPGERTNLLAASSDDPEIQAVRDRLHALVTEYEDRWGPVGECLDEQGELRRYPPLQHETREAYYAARAGAFPRFPSNIVDSAEAGAITPFAEEALEATRDEPTALLHRFNLDAWRDQGATDAFLAKIQREQH